MEANVCFAEKFGSSQGYHVIRLMYIWKEFGGVNHLCDFQLNEFKQSKDTGKSVYKKFKVCSCISILI